MQLNTHFSKIYIIGDPISLLTKLQHASPRLCSLFAKSCKTIFDSTLRLPRSYPPPRTSKQHVLSGPPYPSISTIGSIPIKKHVSPSLPTAHNITPYSSPSSSKNAPLRSRPPSAAFFALMINGTSTITKMPTTSVTKIMVILIFLHLICFLRSLLFF